MVNRLDSATYDISLAKTEYQTVLTRDQVRELVAKYPDWNVELMTDIAFCESSFRKDIVNTKDSHKGCTGSTGLLQVACLYTKEDLTDPEINIKWAYDIWQKQSYNAWKICYNKLRD